MKVVYSARARRDIGLIHDYIREGSPRAAQAVVRRIRSAISRLQDFPLVGRRSAVPGVRELVVTGLPYIVVYSLASDRIEILAVFHGAQHRPD